MSFAKTLILLWSIAVVSGQVATVSVSRQKWIAQATITNAVPLEYRLDSSINGLGLQEAVLFSPALTNAMSGNTFQRTFASNFTSVTVSTNSVSSGLTNFNQSYPTGSYQVYSVVAITNALKKVSYNTNTWAVSLTNGFSAVEPLVTNIAPFTSLSASQNFAWTPFLSNANAGFIEFYVLEGTFDTNILIALSTNGTSVITNFALVANSPRLSGTSSSITVSNINTSLDHVLFLGFHLSASGQTQVPTVNADTLSANLVFYPRAYTNQTSLSITNTTNTVTVSWSTNAGTNLVLTSSTKVGRTNSTPNGSLGRISAQSLSDGWLRVTNRALINARGQFEVSLPAILPQRYFRLEPE